MHRLIFIFTTIFLLTFQSMAYAVEFDESDKRLDLPVLKKPNNAITPQISVDQSDHGYVVWSDNRGGPQKIYINTKFGDSGWQPLSVPINTGYPKPPGVTEDGNATLPQVCSDNSGHVYVVWVDDKAVKANTGKRDIYFRYSKDYGATWYPEFIDYRIDSDNPAVGDSINPQIACDENGNVYIVWEDDRVRPGIYEVYFRSLQVQFSKPVDYIVPYQFPEIRLNTGVSPGVFSARYPVMSTDKNGHVYVVWQDSRNIPEETVYPGIYFNVSKNHGATWNPKDIRVDTAPVGGFYQSFYPVISSDQSGHVYVAWLNNAGRATRGDKYAGDGTFDVYFNVSNDHGASWRPADIRIDVPAKRTDAQDVAIASNNKGLVGIVWASSLESTSRGDESNFNIYFNHSENYGRSFLESEPNIRIDTGVEPGITNAFTPTIAVDSIGNIFIAWVDDRFDTYDIYFNFSIEKGREETWHEEDEEDITLDNPEPPGDSINPVMTIDNRGNVYVAWQDDRRALAPGNYNIYLISGFLDVETLLVAGQRVGEACFIATAAYGSPFESHVELLREFRDKYLMTNGFGRRLVSLYYSVSPPAARFIIEHGYLRPIARVALLPFVGIAMLFVCTTSLGKVALMTFGMIVVMVGTRFVFRRNGHEPEAHKGT